jgi:hypothetical protein
MAKYNFSTLEVEQTLSFEVTDANSIRACACSYGKKSGKKFSVSKKGTTVEVKRVS